MMASSTGLGLIKETGITNTHAKSVKEYSCMEDPNSKFRPYMEDSKKSPLRSRVHVCRSIWNLHQTRLFRCLRWSWR